MDDTVIANEMIKRQIKDVKNWNAPSPDDLHGFWLKHLANLQQCLTVQFNHLLQNSTTEDWMTIGRTFLIIKDH